MKHIFALILILFFLLPAFAQKQQQMLLGQKERTGGGGSTPTIVSVTTPTEENDTTRTVSDVTISGTNKLLLVCISHRRGETNPVLTVLFGLEALTLLQATVSTPEVEYAEVWYLIAPADGTTDDVVITWALAASNCVSVYVLNGVHQTVPFGTVAQATGTSSVSLNVTSVAGDLVIDTLASFSGDEVTVGASQTLRGSFYDGAGMNHFTSSEVATGTTTTMSWTGSVVEWSHIGVAVKAP